MKIFIFESYDFNSENLTATFRYNFDNDQHFAEQVQFAAANEYNEAALQRALFLAFIVTGVSYYKLFPGSKIQWQSGTIDKGQRDFLNKVYQEGLGQFAYENQLTRQDLGWFEVSGGDAMHAVPYTGDGVLSLQSGGKDSLLTSALLKEKDQSFDAFYITNNDSHPNILDTLGQTLYVARRTIDLPNLKLAMSQGGKNGHVPVTYIVLSFSLIQAVLINKKFVLASIGHEGEEPHDVIGDLAVTHQWSKTWQSEQLFAKYVEDYISGDIKVGSPLRQYSELRIAELFIQTSWAEYGHSFSSCNRANYMQGTDNTQLKWCGECPKCANSYLLFAPFLDAAELNSIFAGKDLFAKPELRRTFEGLLGIGDAMKPFECVGEIDELRLAYHMAQKRGGYTSLPFDVPGSEYDYLQLFPSQPWAIQILS